VRRRRRHGAKKAAWELRWSKSSIPRLALGDNDEVGDNDEEMDALLDELDELGSWADSFCADAISSDFAKEASPCGLLCESSEITSATTSVFFSPT
jgi:hypothetical protein